MIKIEQNKLYLVTGGTGFLGVPLIDRIISQGGRVRVMSRNEGKLIELSQKYDIEIYPGDISNAFEVRQAMMGVNGVFHLAASKHVGLAEKFVKECVNSNTVGSLNILEASLHEDVDFVLGISTDKAAQVAGVYGASKLLMERLFNQYAQINTGCEYRIVRYGNVLYSTGSVLCKWKDLIQQGESVIVTAPEATRFFWTVDQALDLIEDCMENATDATPYCPDMKAMSIDDLLTAMIEKYSGGKPILVNVIGLQEGENLHEKVNDNGPYSSEVECFTIEEIKDLI
jgi:UDP-N-acetylglucosamine 4,6-dehydratase/UDP-glucose 4-epimerase